MSNLSQFFSGDSPPVALMGGTPDGGNVYDLYIGISSSRFSLPVLASGTMTAGVYKNVLTVNAKGVLNFAAFGSIGGSRTISLKITIDGGVVYSATSSSGMDRGLVGAGALIWEDGTFASIALDQIPFNTSLVVDVASSDTTGGSIALAYRVN